MSNELTVMEIERIKEALDEIDKHGLFIDKNVQYSIIYTCPVCNNVGYDFADHLNSCSDPEHQIFKVLET